MQVIFTTVLTKKLQRKVGEQAEDSSLITSRTSLVSGLVQASKL
jgi:hypothetical protein